MSKDEWIERMERVVLKLILTVQKCPCGLPRGCVVCLPFHHDGQALIARLELARSHAVLDELLDTETEYPLPKMVDGRTPEELKADGDDRWPDKTPYIPQPINLEGHP